MDVASHRVPDWSEQKAHPNRYPEVTNQEAIPRGDADRVPRSSKELRPIIVWSSPANRDALQTLQAAQCAPHWEPYGLEPYSPDPNISLMVTRGVERVVLWS
ncbi:hypothetical protein NDU88_007960 [Pleurodeles waltl]|uniref:Uncharacterized protein n=1 Tax=Pleurodeles waltl TaxID=8319 RepID=A0AAV7VTS5_PLEWA|nr:hypothetical protein NDU88_007960 [Pleurodeles waltl]